MAEAKIAIKIFYYFLGIIYGINCFELIKEEIGVNTKDIFSESVQTGFAFLGLILFGVKIVITILNAIHKHKLNKIERENLLMQMQFEKDMHEQKKSKK